MSAAFVLALCATAACCYAYAGYPLLLVIAGKIRPRPVQRAAITPTVTVICAAHNEQRTIAAKIRNTLALDYPADSLELIIASDGSTDDTERLVRSCRHARVHLLALPRAGKLAALQQAAARARGEILLFTDANIELERSALRLLVRSFADTAVGGVCARKRFRAPATMTSDIVSRGDAKGDVARTDTTAEGEGASKSDVARMDATAEGEGASKSDVARTDATAEGEGAYWRYDQWVKRLETNAGNVYAADGACYAIRRVLFAPVGDGAQADDIAISARVALQGARLVYDDEAVCWEDAPANATKELRRKVRVANHTLRAVLLLRSELMRAPFYALQLISHKLVRHLVPLFLLVLLGSSMILARQLPLARLAVIAQLAFYALAAVGWTARNTAAGKHPLLAIPFFFSLVNIAAAFALVELLCGRQRTIWAPTSSLSGGRAVSQAENTV